MSKRRGDKPFVELTEGAIRVSWRGHTRTISGAAAPASAETTPDFTIVLDELTFWDPPDENVEIDMAELQTILKGIDEACDRLGLSVEYE